MNLDLKRFEAPTPKEKEQLQPLAQKNEIIAICPGDGSQATKPGIFVQQSQMHTRIRCASINEDNNCAANLQTPPCQQSLKRNTIVKPITKSTDNTPHG